MRLELDTGENDLLARAYLAATIGPFRRPLSSPRALRLVPGQVVSLASNKTQNRVLFVTGVATAGAAQNALVSKGADNSNSFTIVTTIPFSAILYPGEELYAGSVVAAQGYNVFAETF